MITAESTNRLTVVGSVSEHVRRLIADGNMRRCDRLPSFRDLSKDLNVAILVYDSILAHRLIAMLASRGIRVPRDVSVCAVAGAGDGLAPPPLTYCRFDFAGMARKAVSLLEKSCRRPDEPANRVHRIGFKFVEGNTVCKT